MLPKREIMLVSGRTRAALDSPNKNLFFRPSQGFLPNISFQAPRGLMFSFHLPATLSIKSEWPRSMACPWQPLHQLIILLSTSLRKELLLLFTPQW